MTVSGNNNFNDLYERYGAVVYKLGLKYSDYDHELAADATQHTFMKLYQELQKDITLTNVESYLHTIVKNFTINSKVKVKREVFVDESEDGDTRITDKLELSAEEACIETMSADARRQILGALLREMKEYNPIWYRVIIEVFYKERSQAEVAKELGISETAMYATVRRIRHWSNKHRLRIELEVHNKSKEVPEGHLFWLD